MCKRISTVNGSEKKLFFYTVKISLEVKKIYYLGIYAVKENYSPC